MCTYRDTRSWNNAERITIDFPKYWESTRHTHTRARLPEGWWSSFHLICPFPCLLCSVRMCMYVSGVCVCVCVRVCVLQWREKEAEKITSLRLQSPMGVQSQRISGSLWEADSPGTQVCVCVCVCVRKCMCLEVCVEREREGESYLKSRYTGSGQLWTLSLSQLYLHPEYDIQNFYWKVKWLER